MSRLFVIGNGFDLHFGLNTKPEDFEEYLETKSIYNESDNALDYFRCYGVDWSEYEQAMANIEFEDLDTLVTGTVKEMLQYYENITHVFRYDSLTLTP